MSGDASPSCWICLEEGADRLGKSLVRDCCCRGDRAGYAHLSCIKEYAQRASKELDSVRLANREDEANYMNNFSLPWRKCTICHQRYQHELALELANSHLMFVEDNYPGKSSIDYWRYISALMIKIEAIKTMDYHNMPDLREEGKQTSYKMLSVTQEMQNGACCPFVLRRGRLNEGAAHEFIAGFYMSEDNHNEGIKHYENARDIFIELGDTKMAECVDAHIATIKTQYEHSGAVSTDEVELKNRRDIYEYFVRSRGESDVKTIVSGINVADSLRRVGRGIESERLASKLAAISLRVYGAEHDVSRKIVAMLNVTKRRLVICLTKEVSLEAPDAYEVLQYNAGEDQYVVKKARTVDVVGNVYTLQDETNYNSFTVSSNDVVFYRGTPVVCHGLINSSHLNGKIGDVMACHPDMGGYEVHFEDKSQMPVKVRRENLRIVFELSTAAGGNSAAATAAETARAAQAEEVAAAIVEAAEARADEAAVALLAELDLEESTSSTSNQQKGKKKRGKKKRKK